MEKILMILHEELLKFSRCPKRLFFLFDIKKLCDFSKDLLIRSCPYKHYKPYAPKVRKWSNRELKKISFFLFGDFIHVSGADDKDEEGDFYRNYFPNLSSYTLTNYSQRTNSGEDFFLDLEAELPQRMKGKYDVVYNHTTLEHIFDIQKAFKNLCFLSKDIVVVVVPFIQCQHETAAFSDYWRFTPSCLRRLFAENRMTVVYESFSNIVNDANYIFFVASKFPHRWKGTLPHYRKLEGLVAPWVS